MDQYLQRYLDEAFACKLTGHNYNMSTKTCDGSLAPASPASCYCKPTYRGR
eukprot:m.65531 g.65531  ORF g.65531 m.65531 type:complete len:51 (+) comp19639_c0_seq1:336-488(+)